MKKRIFLILLLVIILSIFIPAITVSAGDLMADAVGVKKCFDGESLCILQVALDSLVIPQDTFDGFEFDIYEYPDYNQPNPGTELGPWVAYVVTDSAGVARVNKENPTNTLPGLIKDKTDVENWGYLDDSIMSGGYYWIKLRDTEKNNKYELYDINNMRIKITGEGLESLTLYLKSKGTPKFPADYIYPPKGNYCGTYARDDIYFEVVFKQEGIVKYSFILSKDTGWNDGGSISPGEYEIEEIMYSDEFELVSMHLSNERFGISSTLVNGDSIVFLGQLRVFNIVVTNKKTEKETNKLIVHKYLMEDVGLAGPNGDGTELDLSQLPESASPLKGITFDLYKIDLDSNGHNGKPPIYNDFKFDGQNSPPVLRSPENDTDHPYSLTLVGTETTANGGIATFDGLDDGLYVIVERESDKVEKVIVPCIIPLPLHDKENNKWLKTVHIYPKNEGTPGGPIFPETGGHGTFIFIISGFIVIVLFFGLSMFFFYRKLQKFNEYFDNMK